MKWILHILFIPMIAFCGAKIPEDQAVYNAADVGSWQEVFSDDCIGDWHDKWFLDGEVASVETSTNGLQLTAGPQFGNDAHHMVLWTKESFSGDLKIEYDFTRLDSETRGVCILYIEATGSGAGPYTKDISEWNDLRRIPSMKLYFNHMNLLHISYAAFPNDEDTTQYIRGRRYMPEIGKGLNDTDLKPDYYPVGLFKPGVLHHMTVIKKDNQIFMCVENSEQTRFFVMSNPDLPAVTEGRIGLRQMYTDLPPLNETTRRGSILRVKTNKEDTCRSGKSSPLSRLSGYSGMPRSCWLKARPFQRSAASWESASRVTTAGAKSMAA